MPHNECKDGQACVHGTQHQQAAAV